MSSQPIPKQRPDETHGFFVNPEYKAPGYFVHEAPFQTLLKKEMEKGLSEHEASKKLLDEALAHLSKKEAEAEERRMQQQADADARLHIGRQQEDQARQLVLNHRQAQGAGPANTTENETPWYLLDQSQAQDDDDPCDGA